MSFLKRAVMLAAALGCGAARAQLASNVWAQSASSASVRVETRTSFGGRLAHGLETVGTPDGATAAPWNTTAVGDGWRTLTNGASTAEVAVLNKPSIAVEGGRLPSSATWTSNALHLVRNRVVIPSGVTLTVNAGSVIKFTENAGIVVEDGGTLDLKDNATNNVWFAMAEDDGFGGDTDMREAAASGLKYAVYKFPSGTVRDNGYLVTRGVTVSSYCSLSVNDAQVDEASGMAYVPVTFDGTRTAPFSVDWVAESGMAAYGADFTLASGTVAWTGTSQGTKHIAIPLVKDLVTEGFETFTVRLVTARSMNLARAAATVTIFDSDLAVQTHEFGSSAPSASVRVDTRTSFGGRLAHGTETLGTPDGAEAAPWNTAAVADGWRTLTNGASTAEVAVLNNPAIAVECGRLQSSATWTSNTLHLVRNKVVVPSGVTLTVNAGTVVKFTENTGIVIEDGGTLDVKDNATNNVWFAMAEDDGVGGDTDMRSAAPSGLKYAVYKFPSGTVRDNGYLVTRGVTVSSYCSLSVNDAQVDEASGMAYVPVTFDGTRAAPFSVDWVAESGTAAYGADFTLASGTVAWTGTSQGTKYIAIPLVKDLVTEGFETFTVRVVTARSMNLARGTATITVFDSDVFTQSDGFAQAQSQPSASVKVNARTDFANRIAAVQESLTYSSAWLGVSNTHVRLTAQRRDEPAPVTLYTSAQGAAGAQPWDTAGLTEGRYTLTHQFLDPSEWQFGALTAQLYVVRSALLHGGTLTTNEVWRSDRVHLVCRTVVVPAGVALTIEPGAIVKFAAGTGIQVLTGGTLLARGARFTHVADDALGGDTNMDGGETQPVANAYQLTGNVILDETTELHYTSQNTSGTLAGANAWLPGRIYHVTANVTIPSGATLTVYPGAIVKLAANVLLIVNSGGTLNAVGNRAMPIVFTSVKDDTVGGDTNGDGGATMPQAGDWHQIKAAGGTVTLEHARLLYCSNGNNQGALFLTGGTLTFRNGLIAHTKYDAVRNTGGAFLAENCVFTDAWMGVAPVNGTTTVRNCVFADVTTAVRWASGTFVNCAFANVASIFEEWGPSTFRYCAFYNPAGFGPQSCSLVGSNGNIWGDPRFTDAANGDYTLLAGSPLIDAGDGRVAPELDSFGQPRFDDPYVADTGVAMTNTTACPDIGIYEKTDGMSSETDLKPVDITGPASATVGDTVVIHWQVANIGSQTAAGAWRDVVSLEAADAALGSQTFLLGEYVASATLPSQTTQAFSATFKIPPLCEGRWKFKVQVNAYRDVFEGVNVSNNTAWSSAAMAVSLPTLTNGTTSLVVPAGGSAAFRVTGLTSAGGAVILTAGVGVRVLGSSGYLPSGERYQWTATAMGDGLYLLTFPSGVDPFALFVTLINDGNSSSSVSIEIRPAARELYGVSRRQFPNSGDAVFSIFGMGWSGRATAKLVMNAVAIPAKSLEVSGNEIRAVFPAKGKAAGFYDLIVEEDGEGRTLTRAVELKQGGKGPQWFCNFVMPGATRAGREYTARFEYGNSGDTELPAPYVRFYSDNGGIPLKLDEKDSWQMGSLEVMAASASYPVSMLKPGETRSLLFKFFVPDNFSGSVSLKYAYTLASADAFPWDNNALYMRPTWMSDEMWGYVLASLRGQIGQTWDDYLARMRADLDYLARMGQPTMRVGTLWQMEIKSALNADGEPAVLASATDARRAGRGLNLAFSRWCGSALNQRFQTGLLGYGWTHNFDVRLERNAAGTEVHIVYPGGATRSFWYGTKGSVVMWWGADSAERALYSESGSTCQLAEVSGVNTTFDKASGRLASIADSRGTALTFAYEGDRLSQVTHSDGQWLAFSYSGGQLASVADDTGRMVRYGYAGEMLTSVTASDGRITRYAYLSAPGTARHRALRQIAYPDDTTADYTYDGWGRLEYAARNGSEHMLVFHREDTGTFSISDADGGVYRVYRGGYGETLAAEDPLGRRIRYSYDDATHRLVSVVAPGGKRSTIGYNLNLNPVRIVNPLGFGTDLAYTGRDDLASFTDARGHRVSYGYGQPGWRTLKSIEYPDGSRETYTHSARNDVETWANRRGQTVRFEYDALGRMTRKEWPDGRVFSYGFDSRGNLTNAADTVTGAIALSYDAAERLTGLAYPGGRGFTFAYDDAGRRTRRSAHDGHQMRYEYDPLGRFSALKDGSDAVYARYIYDAAVGRLSRQDYGNGTYAAFAYDLAGQLTNLSHFAAGGAALQRFAYAYDVNGQRTSMTTLAGRHAYGYDAVGQLLTAAAPDGAVETFTYDPVGNRLTSGGATAYTVNSLNQYTAAGGAAFAYDADGNLVWRTEAAGVTTNAYDVENRLVGVTRSDGTVWSCTYDALGNRVEVNDNGVVRRFVYDPVGLTDLAAEYDAGGALVRRYIHGGWLVADEAAAGVRRYYHADALSSTRLLTDASGAVVATRDYTAFGQAKSATGETTPFGYVGGLGVVQDATGLLFMRNRYFAPSEGRFIQADPIGIKAGDVSFYRYCGNRAMDFIDPHGLWQCQVSIGPVVVGVGGNNDEDGISSVNGGVGLGPFPVGGSCTDGNPVSGPSVDVGGAWGVGGGMGINKNGFNTYPLVGFDVGVSATVTITRQNMADANRGLAQRISLSNHAGPFVTRRPTTGGGIYGQKAVQ